MDARLLAQSIRCSETLFNLGKFVIKLSESLTGGIRRLGAKLQEPPAHLWPERFWKFGGHDRVCRKWEAHLSGETSIWTDSQQSPAWMISRAKAGEQRKLVRRSAGTSALLERRLTTLRGALCGRVLLPARERLRRSSGCMRIGRCCASISCVENIYLFSSKLP